MSTGSTILNPCPNLQEELNNHFLTCSASSLREPEPLLDFLLSSENTSSIGTVVSGGRGKTRTVELRYDQRLLESQILEDVANPSCTSDNQRGDCIKEYSMDITENVGYGERFTLSDWHNICRDNSSVFAGIVQRIIDGLYRKTASKVAAQVAALKGKWAADVVGVNNDELVIKTLSAPDVVSTLAFGKIDTALMQTGYCAPAFIAGGTLMYDYFQQAKAGCCATSNVDLGEMFRLYGKAVAYDRKVAAALGGDDRSIVIQSGALSLAQYSANAALEGMNMVSLTRNAMSIRDSKSGLLIDLNIIEDCGDIVITAAATNKVFGMPEDMFQVGDVKAGVNFVNAIKVTN